RHCTTREAVPDAMPELLAGDSFYDETPGASCREGLRGVRTPTVPASQKHPWPGPLARHRIVPAPNFLRALEVLLDTVRAAGYGPRAAASGVGFVVGSLAAMAAQFPRATRRKAKPTSPPQGPLTRGKELVDLPGSEYPRIREAAAPLTRPERPQVYVKLGIGILVRGIESAAPKKRGR